MKNHTFPLRDMNGNVLVRLEYSIPMQLSANAAKMNTFALELSLDSMMLAAGWMNGMLSSETSLNSSLITMGTLLHGISWMGSLKHAAPATLPTGGLKVLWAYEYAQSCEIRY